MLHSGSENALWSIEVGNPEGEPSLFMRATSWRPEASSGKASSKSSGSPNARPSLDGRWLVYTSGGDLYVARYPELTDRVSIASGGGPMWSRSTPELFFRSGQNFMGVRYDVVSGSFKPGRPYPVLKGLEILDVFGISADSQKFLVSMPTEPSEQSQINVVMGWFEELKRLAPTN